ncbi:hypothetical protein HJG60_010249 [Phyllostomus discolor]|uniref:ADP-ribosyl cyclase/cyclic ADP-ribose hydrolase n=1 Tax=Phyllostomus discolor TaxID=89673 RepID=A0A834B1H2_9CHIR|nr:hypothetical protein HJG60_010249 [Phyllostomus discolor]
MQGQELHSHLGSLSRGAGEGPLFRVSLRLRPFRKPLQALHSQRQVPVLGKQPVPCYQLCGEDPSLCACEPLPFLPVGELLSWCRQDNASGLHCQSCPTSEDCENNAADSLWNRASMQYAR